MVSTLRVLVLAFMGSVLVIGNALAVVLRPDDGFAAPSIWAIGGLLAWGVVLHIMLVTTGYRAMALDPELPEHQSRAQSGKAFTSSTLLRLALADSIAMIGVGLAFVVEEGGFLVYATAAALALLLMGYHGWPSERAVERVREQLERDHARSHLREALGLPPRPGGAIQEL